MTNWTKLKSRLVKQQALDKFFLGSSDRHEKGSLPDFTIPDDAYFPLLIDTHLREASAHLDRALSYRREMRELEILAVRSAADYALQREQAAAHLRLDLLRLSTAQIGTDRTSQEKAARAFQAGSSEVAGFKELAVGAGARLEQDLADTNAEARLLNEIYARDKDYQDLFAARHSEHGNAHNYAERAAILASLLQQDIAFARRKCQALNDGFAVIFRRGPQHGFDKNYKLDELVMWLRNLFEDIAIEDQRESEFDLVLPLVQKIGAQSGLLTADAWKNAINNLATKKKLELEFKLKDEHLLGRKFARIKRVGLSYGTRVFVEPSGIDRVATYESYCRYRGELIPPPQAPLLNKYKRPPISLGAISVYGAPIDYSEGQEVANLSPVGAWRVTIDQNPTTKNIDERDMKGGADGSTPWIDLKLHLRLCAQGKD